MIGLGTQQTIRDAEDFVSDTGPFTMPVFWDESGRSWAELGVVGQPTVALFLGDGTLVDTWFGSVDRALDLLTPA